MKLNLVFKILFFSTVFSFCGINYINAQSEVHKKALAKKYPDATRVEWEIDDGYIEAEFFDTNYQKVKVEFDSKGNWVRTKTDVSYRNLPESIKTTFKNSQYADWKIDEIGFIERLNHESVYIFELEKGEMEYKLLISDEGTIIMP